jgi:phosphatidylethanolamine N-methyltransferase
VSKPVALDLTSIREYLTYTVPLCLDSDPDLIPLSCGGIQETADTDPAVARDVDDFSFWSEQQAKRICYVIKQAFGVEYAPDVVVADANLTALANRILVSKQLLVL